MSVKHCLVPCIFLATLCGCAGGKSLYAWSEYDAKLYRYYKNPENRDEYRDELISIIETSEEKGRKVPPGIYAEYGYLLLEDGATNDALSFFEKEQQTWPASAVFMQKLSESASSMEPNGPQPNASGSPASTQPDEAPAQ